MGKSQELYLEAKSLIPGGTQLLSKRPEMFLPGFWPAYYERASGCRIWDLDGKEYIDMSYMGIGANILGYSDPDVNLAVKSVIDKGNMSTLNAPEEVELAKLLLSLHPWAGMVRYARTGGESMAIAIRIARAKSRKDKILFCGYHGWHDWYLAANLSSDNALEGHLLPGLSTEGVPKALTGTSFPFFFNDTKGFLDIFEANKKEIGTIVMEPIRNDPPQEEFIKNILEVKKKHDLILIVDEITSGWRLNLGGAHLLFNLEPDIAVFGKGLSNGYPMGAVIGKKNVMEKVQDTFISSTYWTDRIGPVAAIACIDKMRRCNVANRLKQLGIKIKEAWILAAKEAGLDIKVSGIDPLSHFIFADENHLALKTLFTQFMLERGFLATNAFYASFAHTDKDLDSYIETMREAFKFISMAIADGNIEALLNGDICHSGFKRLT